MAPAFRRGDENRPQRWILASSRVNGAAVPGSLSEGAAEAKLRLRECSSMNVSTQKFQSLYALVGNRWHGGTIGGHSLSQPLRAASSLREGAGKGCVPFNVPPGNRKVSGDFHRPYEGSGNFTFCHSSGDTPSVSPCGLPAPSGREPGAVNYFRRFAISFPSKLKVTSVFLWVRL